MIKYISTLIQEKIKNKGIIFILSSLSGVGKTTLTKKIIQTDKNISLSISYTTRKKRINERKNKHYFFINSDEFKSKIKQKVFLEYSQVYDQFYGTSKQYVTQQLLIGNDLLFDIDGQGCRLFKNKYKNNIVSIFLLPPSIKELYKRLSSRNSNKKTNFKRMKYLERDISYWKEYDYVIINNNIQQCLNKLLAILKVERIKLTRKIEIKNFVINLIQQHKRKS